MVYKLDVTDHADELLDNLVYHLIYRLKNKEAAKYLLDSVESIYDRLVENPYQFPKSRDMYLAKKGYYEAVIPQMNYIVIFDVRKGTILDKIYLLELLFPSKHPTQLKSRSKRRYI